jgi:predicted metal-dependent phosphoesterase TrpH
LWIDLHTHSTASDGGLTPAELVGQAARRGLSALALTDHDTIAGLDSAETEAAKQGIQFIRGIEIAINWEPGEFHLLGLGLRDPIPVAFVEALDSVTRQREVRNRAIIDRMHTLNIEVEYEDIVGLSGGTVVGRPHFAAFLKQKKMVKTIEQAFSLYLSKGRPLYLPKKSLDFEQAAALIHDAGGIAVLAHPLSLYISWKRLPELIFNLRKQGLDGIEAWHPAASVGCCARLEQLGKSAQLLITAGSDFHGKIRPNRKLGITAGGRKINETLVSDTGLWCQAPSSNSMMLQNI